MVMLISHRRGEWMRPTHDWLIVSCCPKRYLGEQDDTGNHRL